MGRSRPDRNAGLNLVSERLSFRTDISMVSNRGTTGSDPNANFGDFQITPRILLSETRDVTRTLDLTFRTPTGNSFNANGVAAISPTYNFWANSWQGLEVRGGAGVSLPYAGQINNVGARSTFNANLAVGYYFTPHDFTPVGDLVWYLSTNLTQAIDNRTPRSTTLVTLTPGFRTHMGDNWYPLGAVEVPVTYPQPYDYQVLGSVMKVY